MDPTTYRATAKKIFGEEDLQMNLEFAKDNLTGSKSGTSRDTSNNDSTGLSIAPKVRLEDLQEPTRMTVEAEKSRFWVSDTREGEVVSVGSVQRVVALETKEEPITWECGAPMLGGKLCKRQDRKVCPFHGVIVKRDAEGKPLEDPAEGSSSGPKSSVQTPTMIPKAG